MSKPASWDIVRERWVRGSAYCFDCFMIWTDIGFACERHSLPDEIADRIKAITERMGALIDLDHEYCRGCNNEIDPYICHCGQEKDCYDHRHSHQFIPMGCRCVES